MVRYLQRKKPSDLFDSDVYIVHVAELSFGHSQVLLKSLPVEDQINFLFRMQLVGYLEGVDDLSQGC